jgi:tetratricopeptide (TPR) repeat protein
MFRKVLDSKPPPRNASAIRYYLAGALTMAKKTDEALQEMRKAVEANPNNPRYESRIAWILYQAKRMPEAAEEYENLIQKHAAKQQAEFREIMRSARLALSNIALEQGNFPQAVEWLEQVLDEYPEDPGALNDLGYLWAERGLHLQRSLRMTQKAVELEPKNHSYRDSLGWAYYQLGRYDDAVRELIAATTDNEQADGVLFDHLGDALLKQGKPAEAKQAWQRAREAFQKAGEMKKAEAVEQKLK